MFVDNEAGRADLTTGAARNRMAPMLVYTMWSVTERYEIAVWVERVPSKPNPADLPSGGQVLPLETGPNKELASSDELRCV